MKCSPNILIAYLVLSTTACSQSNKIVKGYAYARNILGGVKPGVILSEDGTITTKSQKPGTEYFIYAVTKDSTMPVVKNIWIEGKAYFAAAEKVRKLPVIIETNRYDSGQKDTLVQKEDQHAWKINVGKLISADSAFTRPVGELKDPVYIGFLSSGKIQYYPIKALKFLKAVRLE